MRILMISTLYPPFVQGGAEISAHNLATWLAAQGHEVAVLTTAPTAADELWDEMSEGCRIFRVSMPRQYTVFEATTAPGWKKPLWHLQDHFDPRNRTIVDKVLDEFKPDVVNVQYLQGIGYNALKSIAERDLPTVYTLHDLGLACVKMAMFIDGKECAGLCTACGMSAKVKMGYLGKVERLGFISPSTANMAKLASLQPIGDYPQHRVLNANEYPAPRIVRSESPDLRLLYVGRLHETKGVDIVLKALDMIALNQGFRLDILGSGPDEARWREEYGDRPWLRFHGQVSLQDVADAMISSDALLVPSIWLENSPGVVIQALSLSLPVIGSDKGGIPELVSDGVNGILVEPGNVAAWHDAIKGLLDTPGRLDAMRINAGAGAIEFDKNTLGHQALAVFEAIRARPTGATPLQSGPAPSTGPGVRERSAIT
ncbi:glycosyltransferase family 4 protein [soil metagenome]